MMILILFIGLGIGITVLLNHPFFRDYDDAYWNQIPTRDSGPRPRSEASPGALPFEEFCARKCAYRYVCLRKRAGRKAGTCLEYELKTTALW